VTEPRLIPLAEAKAYLGGRHPVSLGIPPVARGLWDRKAIDAWLDRKSGLEPQLAVHGAANDEADEIEALARRITDAPRRA
jgi:hypothetical protein